MQAIQTKYLGPTNFRPSRIKASCERGSITVSYPLELSGDDVHRFAVRELVKRFAMEDFNTYKTPPEKNPWMRPTVCGGLPDGTTCHVFIGEAGAFMDQQTVSNRAALRAVLNDPNA